MADNCGRGEKFSEPLDTRARRAAKRELQGEVEAFIDGLFSHDRRDRAHVHSSYQYIYQQVTKLKQNASRVPDSEELHDIFEKLTTLGCTLSETYRQWCDQSDTPQLHSQPSLFQDVEPQDSASNISSNYTALSCTPSELARKQIDIELERKKLQIEAEAEAAKIQAKMLRYLKKPRYLIKATPRYLKKATVEVVR